MACSFDSIPIELHWYLKSIVVVFVKMVESCICFFLKMLILLFYQVCALFSFNMARGTDKNFFYHCNFDTTMLDINCAVLLKCLKILLFLFISSQSCDIFPFLGYERVCQTGRYFGIHNRCCRMESRSGTCTTTTESHD